MNIELQGKLLLLEKKTYDGRDYAKYQFIAENIGVLVGSCDTDLYEKLIPYKGQDVIFTYEVIADIRTFKPILKLVSVS